MLKKTHPPASLDSTGLLDYITGGSAAGVWTLPLPFTYSRGYEWMELCFYSPYMPSWREQRKRGFFFTLRGNYYI